jgi:hypothetical protein
LGFDVVREDVLHCARGERGAVVVGVVDGCVGVGLADAVAALHVGVVLATAEEVEAVHLGLGEVGCVLVVCSMETALWSCR